MAFGIRRAGLEAWKLAVSEGEIAFLTHYRSMNAFLAAKR